MQLKFLTSSSELNPISDFQYLYDLAKCSKCQMFVLLKSTNKLYGASDDCSSIHEIDIPFLVNTDLEFRLDTVDKSMISACDSYFVPDMYPWVILPSYYWDMYIGGDIYTEFSNDSDVFVLYDKTTKQPIQQIQMYKHRVQYDRGRNYFIGQLSNFLTRCCSLLPPHTFMQMEQHPTIRKAFDSKAAMGRFLCRLTNDNIDVAVYFYKGLFTLSKSDTLEIDIRFDVFNSKEFMATYRPKKKKNPLTFNRYGVAFREQIHCMYRNII